MRPVLIPHPAAGRRGGHGKADAHRCELLEEGSKPSWLERSQHFLSEDR